MPRVRFEPTIPASERAKTDHALDRSTTVTGKVEVSLSFISGSFKEAVSISNHAESNGRMSE
jgi:hypothetical protein